MSAGLIERFRDEVNREIAAEGNLFSSGKLTQQTFERHAGIAIGLSKALDLLTIEIRKTEDS